MSKLRYHIMESLVVERPRPPNADIRGLYPVEVSVYPFQLRDNCTLFIIRQSMAVLARGQIHSEMFCIIRECRVKNPKVVLHVSFGVTVWYSVIKMPVLYPIVTLATPFCYLDHTFSYDL
jgi:hypothetical protein